MVYREDFPIYIRTLQEEFPKYTVSPTGSTLINGKGKDFDILLHRTGSNPHERLVNHLGFVKDDGDAYQNDLFDSYKCGNINVIVPHTIYEKDNWLLATRICQFLSDGKMPKPVRVAIFQLVRVRCSLEDMHEDIMNRFGGYQDDEDVAPVDEMALRPAVPLPNEPVQENVGV